MNQLAVKVIVIAPAREAEEEDRQPPSEALRRFSREPRLFTFGPRMSSAC